MYNRPPDPQISIIAILCFDFVIAVIDLYILSWRQGRLNEIPQWCDWLLVAAVDIILWGVLMSWI